MYDRLGIHWASSIPAFLAVACLPFPFLFYKYGLSIRQKCKYAAEADAFMQRIRGQAQTQQDDQPIDDPSPSTSRTASVEAEEFAEQEAADYSYKQESQPHSRFEEMKTEKEKEMEDDGLKKVQTGRSSRSRKSAREQFYDNPYEIDRVHTRESFRPVRSRTTSLSRTKSRQ
jgi:hypothetical protein